MNDVEFWAINRVALIVRPKQPYIDWANGLEESGPKLSLERPNQEYTIYLVEELDLDLDPGPALQRHHSSIFEQELAGWHRDPSAWPQNRNLRTFLDWFDVEMHSMVVDLAEIPLEFEWFAG
jgi:hypothetical protein